MESLKEEYIRSHDGEEVFVRIWDGVHEPKGIMQIFHGMAEHSERYDEFAKYLNSKGFIVYADDHRGHGNSASRNIYGYIGENGFYNIVEDEWFITKLIKDRYPNLPIVIFAHSFGSFIGQEYITRYSKDISGVILSGSAKRDGFDIKLGSIVAKIQSKIFDDKKEAKLIDKLSFGSYNKKVQNENTKFDWLSRDREEVDKYINDKHCAFISTINFYNNLFSALNNLYIDDKLQKIRKELPMLIIAGDKDPVGKYGESVKSLYNQYLKLNIDKVEMKLYEEGRHELLNEINKEDVFEDINSWISKI